ncbi:N-acetyltransferase [Streptomyces sp. NPDC051940]|uniref:GNAT family N-acetyltransferase n=1 Tax=Streptomyces sp. NPDC051940 TaxID=3155675 RepID=UPI003439B2C0
MTGTAVRPAGPGDAPAIARLHADSWRRHYRGAYADAFLDGDVVADRHAVWAARLADGAAPSATFVAEGEGAALVGFVHAVLDDDPGWGSLVDNLHVAPGRQRAGVGTALLAHAGAAITERAATPAAYLWVLEQNDRAQRFYEAQGGVRVERAAVMPPGGDPARLNGAPVKLRMAWPGGIPGA